MAKTSYDALEKRAINMLGYLLQIGGPSRPAVASSTRLREEFNLSAFQVHHILQLLEEAALIEVEPRFAEDGGRLSNAFYVTPAGRRALSKGYTSAVRRKKASASRG